MIDHINILDSVIEKIVKKEAHDLEERIGITIILIGSFCFKEKIIVNSLYDIFVLTVHYITMSHNEYMAIKHLH